jgi:hypothetical protein
VNGQYCRFFFLSTLFKKRQTKNIPHLKPIGHALAILVPILVRSLMERSMAVQRQTVIIIDNLCKLVRDPAEAGQFLPQLLPYVKKNSLPLLYPI